MAGVLDLGTLLGHMDLDLGPFEESLNSGEGLLGKAGANMSKSAKFIGAGIGAVLAAAVAAAIQFDAVQAKITNQLGLSKEESGRIGKVAGALFASNYGDSLDQVGEAIGSVVKNIDGMRTASDATLKSITGQVISLANTFDEDLGAVTRSVGVLMKTGLAKDAQEALDIVTKGLQSPVNAAGDLLDTFDEYSTIFRSLGLDGKAALGLLSQGLQGGARDADQVADSLKELLLRIQGGDAAKGLAEIGLNIKAVTTELAAGGERASAATDLILDGFNRVKDPAEKSALALQLFGTKAEDAQTALGKLDPSTAAAEFEAAYGVIDGAAQSLDATAGGTLQGGIESLWRKLQGLAKTLGDDLGPTISGVTGFLSGLITVVADLLGWVGDLPTPLLLIGSALGGWLLFGPALVAMVVGLAGSLGAAAIAARGFIASLGPVGLIITGVVTAMSFLLDTGPDVDEILQSNADAAQQLADSLDQATGAITDNTRATLVSQLQASGMLDQLDALGISTKTYVDAALGGAGAQKELGAAVDAAGKKLLSQSDAYRAIAEDLSAAGISQDEFMAALASGDWSGLTDRVTAYAEGVASSTGNTSAATDIQERFYGAVEASTGPLQDLAGVMGQSQQTADGLASSQADVAQRTTALGEESVSAADKLQGLATMTGLSADEIQRQGEAAGLSATEIAKIQKAAAAATPPNQELADALASGSSAASEMDAAVQQLQLAMITLAGGTVNAEQAARAHEATIRAVGAAARDYAAAQAEVEVKSKALTDAQNNLGKSLEEGGTTAADVAAAQRDLEDAQDGVKNAADKQADSLDSLAQSAVGMTARSFDGAGGMKNYDAAVAAATTTMEQQRAQFVASAIAAGMGEQAANDLATAQGLIPDNVKTSYDAIRAQEAEDAAKGVGGAVDSVDKSPTITFGVNDGASGDLDVIRRKVDGLNGKTFTFYVNAQTNKAATNAQGVVGSYYRGGLVPGYAGGGLLPGTPPRDPSLDNLLAMGPWGLLKVRSREFISPQPSVDYYGVGLYEALRNQSIPKSLTDALLNSRAGFATGGQLGQPAAATAANGGEVHHHYYALEFNTTQPVDQWVVMDAMKELERTHGR